PGQTILELGCGSGVFTRRLASVCRGENSITAVTFAEGTSRPAQLPTNIEFLHASSMFESLRDRHYDFIVAMDLLDRRNCTSFLQTVYRILKPGGQVVFYQSNPWNVVLKHNLAARSEEHTSELQSRVDIVCRLVIEKKK